MDEQQAIGAEFLPGLYGELDRASRCEMVWVMDLEWYKRMRRYAAACRPKGEPEPDEDKWVPSIDDRLLGQRMLVRGGGGEPHIEWMTREEMGIPGPLSGGSHAL